MAISATGWRKSLMLPKTTEVLQNATARKRQLPVVERFQMLSAAGQPSLGRKITLGYYAVALLIIGMAADRAFAAMP